MRIMPLEEMRYNIPEMDTDTAMQYCADDESLVAEILQEYLESSKAGLIQKYYDESDWENYRIQVHSLKSTSLTIGFVELSEEAKKLEFAARDNDTAYIHSNHDSVMKHYNNVLKLLSEV